MFRAVKYLFKVIKVVNGWGRLDLDLGEKNIEGYWFNF